MELEVNWIDAAAVYELGHSEEIAGQAIKDLSPRPLIATKRERVWDKKGNGGLKRKFSPTVPNTGSFTVPCRKGF